VLETSLLSRFDPVELSGFLAAALSKGGDYADLYFEENHSASFVLEDGGLKKASTGAVQGVGVRVLAGERTGYAYTEDCRAEAIRKAALTAASIADHGATVDPIQVKAGRRHDLYRAKVPLVASSPQTRLRYLLEADAAARDVDPRIQTVIVDMTEQIKRIAVVSSVGTVTEDEQPMTVFRVTCAARDGDVRTKGGESDGGRVGLELLEGGKPAAMGRVAAEQAIRSLTAQSAPAGPQEVVLGNAYSGVLLHEAVGHGLEADFNRKGFSRYAGQVGQRVASPLVSVIDDGTIEDARGSINLDDEGNPSGRAVLIEDGILTGYLHDRLSARLMGVDATGNGRRQSYRHAPMPRMTNTFMPGGTHDPEEIIRSVKRGIYAKRFGGGQVEIGKGDFVFGATEAYLIEDGKITAPLRDVILIGNGPEVMSRVEMVGTDYELSDGTWTCGKDGQSVPVGVGMPSVKISSITVGGTGS